MGFKYVLVPADSNEEMKEITYAKNVDTLEKDDFREDLTTYFAACGKSVDREVIIQQLQERTGMNLKEQLDKGDMKGDAMERVLQATSVEIFPVMLPTKEVGFNSISVYCDDKGIAKELEENVRVSSLVQACGYPGQTFRGDCFIGRVFDDTEDEWRRTDFTLADCSSDAEWVAQCKHQRANRSKADMSGMASQFGMKNPARLDASMLEDAPKGETEKYTWRQTDEDVEVTFKVDLTKGDKRSVKVLFSRQKLKVTVKDEALVDVELGGLAVPDESTWTLSDGQLQVTLAKASPGNWSALVKT